MRRMSAQLASRRSEPRAPIWARTRIRATSDIGMTECSRFGRGPRGRTCAFPLSWVARRLVESGKAGFAEQQQPFPAVAIRHNCYGDFGLRCKKKRQLLKCSSTVSNDRGGRRIGPKEPLQVATLCTRDHPALCPLVFEIFAQLDFAHWQNSDTGNRTPAQPRTRLVMPVTEPYSPVLSHYYFVPANYLIGRFSAYVQIIRAYTTVASSHARMRPLCRPQRGCQCAKSSSAIVILQQ